MDTRTRERTSLILNCEPDEIPGAVLRDVELLETALARIGVGTPTDRELAVMLLLSGHLSEPAAPVPEPAMAGPRSGKK